MSLAEHLRADEGLRLSAAKALQDAHQRSPASRGIAIEHVDGDLREIAAEAFLHFLRAETDRLQHLATAQRAFRWDGPAQSAVVAEQHPGPAMDGHRHAAVAAAKVMAAFAAEQVRRITPAVDEDDGLLARGECLLQRRLQRRAEDHEAAIFFFRALRPEIDDVGLRQRACLHPLRQPQECVLSASRVVPALQRWRGGSENDRNVAKLRADDRKVTGVAPVSARKPRSLSDQVGGIPGGRERIRTSDPRYVKAIL